MSISNSIFGTLFDSVKDSIKKKYFDGDISQATQFLSGADKGVREFGGWNAVVNACKSSGLGDFITSAISTGPNKTCAADTLAGALPFLKKLAKDNGIDLEKAAQAFTDTVDEASPEGTLPS